VGVMKAPMQRKDSRRSRQTGWRKSEDRHYCWK
jgi:hypothetical protein